MSFRTCLPTSTYMLVSIMQTGRPVRISLYTTGPHKSTGMSTVEFGPLSDLLQLQLALLAFILFRMKFNALRVTSHNQHGIYALL